MQKELPSNSEDNDKQLCNKLCKSFYDKASTASIEDSRIGMELRIKASVGKREIDLV